MARARTLAMNARCQKARKRPLSAYNIFLSKFMKTQCISSIEDAQKALKAGAKLWNKMSCQEKKKYGRHSPKILAGQETSGMTNHWHQLQALKSPPRPFAAFLKDYYYSGHFELKREGEKGRDIICRLSKCASAAWHNLQPSQRHQYTKNFQAQYQEHKMWLLGREQLMNTDSKKSALSQLEPGQSAASPPLKNLDTQDIRLGASTVCNSNTRPKPILRKSGKFGRRGKGARAIKKTLRFSEDNDFLG